MSFGIKDFTPEQLAKWQKLNPNLFQDLGLMSSDPEQAEKDYQEALKLNTETWAKVEQSNAELAEAYREYVKAKKGKPLFQKGELLAALLFFLLLLVLI